MLQLSDLQPPIRVWLGDALRLDGLRFLRSAPGLLPTHDVRPGLLVSPDLGWRGEAHPGGLGDGAEDAALRPDQLQTLTLTAARYSLKPAKAFLAKSKQKNHANRKIRFLVRISTHGPRQVPGQRPSPQQHSCDTWCQWPHTGSTGATAHTSVNLKGKTILWQEPDGNLYYLIMKKPYIH